MRAKFLHRSRWRFRKLKLILCCAAVLEGSHLGAQPIAVRHMEGAVHGFLSLTSLAGVVIADGDLEQSVHGSRVTSRLTFRFRDGSLQDETTVFSQSGHFRLLSDHLIQKGAAFKRQMDLAVNASTGTATARYSEDDGKEKVETVHLALPPDVANGMVPIFLKNLPPGTPMSASMVVAAPKPQLVKLAISPEGEDRFLTGGLRRKATRFIVKVEIGGVKGVLAPLLGKQPPDTRVWILHGIAPAFLKSEGPTCQGCPIWRTELASPAWPKGADEASVRQH